MPPCRGRGNEQGCRTQASGLPAPLFQPQAPPASRRTQESRHPLPSQASGLQGPCSHRGNPGCQPLTCGPGVSASTVLPPWRGGGGFPQQHRQPVEPTGCHRPQDPGSGVRGTGKTPVLEKTGEQDRGTQVSRLPGPLPSWRTWASGLPPSTSLTPKGTGLSAPTHPLPPLPSRGTQAPGPTWGCNAHPPATTRSS